MKRRAAVTLEPRSIPAVPRWKQPDLRDSIRMELTETRRQLNHYARLTTSLELQLETLDRQATQCYRRMEQLANNLELEEERLATAGEIAPASDIPKRIRREREAAAV